MKFFIKYGGLLLEILVVAAIVFFVFWLNPGNIFGSGLRFKDTASNISEIKQIGQLVTAEYYGEVIATYDESELQLVEEEEVGQRADDLFRDMKAYLLDKHLNAIAKKIDTINDDIDLPKLEKKERKGFFARLFNWGSKPKKEFKKELEKSFDDEKNDPSEGDEKELLFTNELTPEILAFYFDKNKIPEAGKKTFENLFWKLFQEVKQRNNQLSDSAFDEYMKLGLTSMGDRTFSDFHYENKRKKSKNSEELKKVSLAMMGRGWVKAGIDFGEFNERNFIYDKEHGVVHIYGVYPKILDKDINPWFIPEKQVPGFQILESRKANFEHAKKVKLRCIAKLEKMAREAGIVLQAEEQCKETIKNFIGLLTETEVREVYFHNDRLTVTANEIIADQLITFEEAVYLDTLIQKELQTIDSIAVTGVKRAEGRKKKARKQKRLKDILTLLKTSEYNEFITCFKEGKEEGQRIKNDRYNKFSFITDSIVFDSVLTTKEYQKLKALRIDEIYDSQKIKSNIQKLELEVWYPEGSLGYIADYNNMLCTVKEGTKYFGGTVEHVTIEKKDSTDWFKNWEERGLKYTLLNEFEENLTYRLLEKLPDSIKLEVSELRYKVYVPKDWKKELSEKKKGIKYFEKPKLENGKLKIEAAPFFERLNSYQITEKDTIDCTTLQFKRVDDSWKITDSSCDDLKANEEQRLIIENMINQILAHQGPGWFTRTSQKVKDYFNQ